MKLLTISLAAVAAVTLTGCNEDVYVSRTSSPGYYGGYSRHHSTAVVVDSRPSYYHNRPYGYGYRAPVRHDTVVVAGRSPYRSNNTVVVARRTTPSNVVVVDKRKHHKHHDD